MLLAGLEPFERRLGKSVGQFMPHGTGGKLFLDLRIGDEFKLDEDGRCGGAAEDMEIPVVLCSPIALSPDVHKTLAEQRSKSAAFPVSSWDDVPGHINFESVGCRIPRVIGVD